MAVTWKGRVANFAADNDTIAGKIRVNAIALVADGTSGATVIKVGGASGITIYNATPTVSTTTFIYGWAEPQELDDLIAETMDGTHVQMVVFTC